jgi:hypothetical protein
MATPAVFRKLRVTLRGGYTPSLEVTEPHLRRDCRVRRNENDTFDPAQLAAGGLPKSPRANQRRRTWASLRTATYRTRDPCDATARHSPLCFTHTFVKR